MSSAPSAAKFDARRLVASLPEEPGVYRMTDASGGVLYVGKAKNLKKRVASYFREGNLSPRIRLMVLQIAGVEISATQSEAEALILENNLIKALAPKFNILFRDDKSYPYIELSAETTPRISFHRGPFAKGARYFGPFPNVHAVRESIHLLQRVFQLRTCEPSVFQNRSRPCLLHQIHRCSGPCVDLISATDYARDARLAELFLRGRHNEVMERIAEAMHAAANALQFEKAAILRDQVRALQKVLHRQFVESANDENADVIVALVEQGVLCVNHAIIRGGRHLGDRAHFPQNAQDCSVSDGLAAFLQHHYVHYAAPERVLLNLVPSDEVEAIMGGRSVVSSPRSESERAWVAMAEKNARIALFARTQTQSHAGNRLELLRQVLELSDAPSRIECFDISHTMGEGTVASCVVCLQGAMHKAEYRRYNIAGIKPGDDCAAMRQALFKRYEKVAAGEGICPDLVLIDGGKAQVAAARGVLAELNLGQVPAVGIAKGEERKPGLEELFPPNRSEPLVLEATSGALHLIQQVRDEAHRFALAGHRARRARQRKRSQLEDIPGVGPARRKRLLAQFGGMQSLLAATTDDLARVQGISRKLAEAIYNLLH